MFKKAFVVFIVCLLCGCGANNSDEQDFTAAATEFTNEMIKGDFILCFEKLNDKTKSVLSAQKLQDAYTQVAKDAGSFVEIEKTKSKKAGENQVVTVFCMYEKTGITALLTYEKSGKVAGLWLNFYEPEAYKPQNNTDYNETDFIVGEGTEWALNGKLTKGAQQSMDSVVILVQGSGATDMDESIFENKPFRDIAYGLAEQGIASLRYDKRTFAYAQKLASEKKPDFTIKDETINDAITAAKQLKKLGYKNIFYCGHSLGAMVALRADLQSGGIFKGLIMLAGSPRSLVDVILKQNEVLIENMTDETQKQAAKAQVQAETDKLNNLNTLSDEQLRATTFFGMPGIYMKDLLASDTAVLARKYNKPALVLQGGQDFQVLADVDFLAYKEAFKGKNLVEFILYNNLNHLFMDSQAAPKEALGTIEEYKIPAKVDKKVINDISQFVLK